MSELVAPFSEDEFDDKASWAETIVTVLVTTLAVLFVSFLAVVMAMS